MNTRRRKSQLSNRKRQLRVETLEKRRLLTGYYTLNIASTLDPIAVEPHSTRYAISEPANPGEFRVQPPNNWPGRQVHLEVAPQSTATFGTDYTIQVNQRIDGSSEFSPVTVDWPQTTSYPYKFQFFVGSNVAEVQVKVTLPNNDNSETDSGETVIIRPEMGFYPEIEIDPYGGPPLNEFDFNGTASITITDADEPLILSAFPTSISESSSIPARILIKPQADGVSLAGDAYLRFDTTGSGIAIPGVDFNLFHPAGVPILIQETSPGIYETEEFHIAGSAFLIHATPINDTLLEGIESIIAELRTKPINSQPDRGFGSTEIAIFDDEVSRTVTLSTTDGTAEEPHGVYYLPPATVDTGKATLTFSNWPGGKVELSLNGSTATLDSDYAISLGEAPINTTLSNLELTVPAGASSVTLLVEPKGDLIENETEENVILEISSVPMGVSSSGTANIKITDLKEELELDATPDETLEYRTDPNYANFRITPAKANERMKGVVFLEIDASEDDSATPGIDFTLEVQSPAGDSLPATYPNAAARIAQTGHVVTTEDIQNQRQFKQGNDSSIWIATGSVSALVWKQVGGLSPIGLQFTLINPSNKIYRTSYFSIENLSLQLVRVKPINDSTLEQVEKINATLKSEPRYALPYPGDSGVHGNAVISIKEAYEDAEMRNDGTPDYTSSCSCSCTCAGLPEVYVELGSFANADQANKVEYRSEDQNSQNSVLRAKLELPAGKAIPTQIDVVANLVGAHEDENGNLIGLGRQIIDQVFSASILVQTPMFDDSLTAGRYIWVVIQPELAGIIQAWSNQNSDLLTTGANQGIANLELLAHPKYSTTLPTTERFSGWVGRHAHLFTDRSQSGVARDFAPGMSIKGVDRTIPNASILVPDAPPGSPSGGAVKKQAGTALFRSDGSTAWFKDSSVSPSNTLSKLNGSTLTKRDGSKSVFDVEGKLAQEIDPQGNTTTFNYDTYGRISTETDPLGQTTTYAYRKNGTYTTSASADRLIVIDPYGVSAVYTYTQNPGDVSSGTLSIVHTDPDGTSGARKALVENWTFDAGFLESIDLRRQGITTPERLSEFSYDFYPTQSGQQRGTRRVTSISRSDGSTKTIAKAAQFEGVILPEAGGSPLELAFNIKSLKEFSDETLITETVGGTERSVLYTFSPGGYLRERLDAEQFARLYHSGYSSSPLTPSQKALRSSLSWSFTTDDPNRDDFGNILGQYLGLPSAVTSPDPDLIVSGFATVSNGSRTRQTTQYGYSDGNATSVTLPTLPTQSFTYNNTFDIAKTGKDSSGNPFSRTVDSFGLVTHETFFSARSNWHSPYNRFDVSADGHVSAIDSLLINNFLYQNSSQYPPELYPNGIPVPHPLPVGEAVRYRDVNGDGFVSTADSDEVNAYIHAKNQNEVGIPTPLPSTAPRPLDEAFKVTRQYTSSANGLPRGLVTEERLATGRAFGDLVTTYTYVDYVNTPAATPAQLGQLRSITEAPGTVEQSITQFEYDARGNLTKVTDPLGRINRFYYDNLNRITATLGHDPDGSGPLLGLATRFDYDVFGNVITHETLNSAVDSGSLVVKATKTGYVYNDLDVQTGIYEQNPLLTWYVYVDGNGVVQETDTKATAVGGTPLSSSSLQSYLAGNPRIKSHPVLDPLQQGLVTTIAYNEAGEPTSITETPSGNVSAARVTGYDYDRLGRVVQVLSPSYGLGLVATPTDRKVGDRFLTNFSYDALGNLNQTIDPLGNMVEQKYDSLNRIIAQTRPHPTSSALPAQTTDYSYSPTRHGWDITETNSEGQSITTTVDQFGRTVAVKGDTPAQWLSYWTDGSLRSTMDADQEVTDFDYTLRGQVKSVTQPAATSGGTRPTTSYVYFVDGRLDTTTDPLGRVTDHVYRADGLLQSRKTPDPDNSGPLLYAFNSYTYDSLGNLLTLGDSLQNLTSFAYDSQSRQTATVDARGATTTTTYTLFDEVESITDALGNVTSYVYNGVGLPVTETKTVSGVNRNRSYGYDGAGNLRQTTDRNGRSTFYAYDNWYRMTEETWKTGSTVNQSFGYAYDTVGNLTSVTDSGWLSTQFEFVYNDRNELDLERQAMNIFASVPFVIDRDYASDGNLTKVALNLGGAISGNSVTGGVNDLVNTLSYDALNRLTSTSQQSANAGNAVAPKLATFAYDIASQMTDVRRYSATSVDTASLELHSRYLYDLAGRVTSITHAKTEIAPNHGWSGTATLPSSMTAPNVVAAYSLKYDRDNRLTSFGSYVDRFTTAYSYNATDELTAATSTAIAGLTAPSFLPPSQSLGFDLNGNRTSSTGASQSAEGTHNQLQSDAQFSYTYDHEGNLTRKTSLATGAVTDFTWDHRNRLISVTERPTVGGAMTKQSIYAYDAFNRRTVDRLNRDGIGGVDQADYWVFDGQHALMQIRDSDGTGSAQGYRIANRFLHGAAVDQVLSDEQYSNGTGPLVSATVSSSTPGTTYWTATDHLGSVRDLIDNNGVTRQHVVYDSFGNRLSEVDRNAAGTVIASTDAAAIDTIFGYTGRDWDKDTGLQNNRARWYDPTTGRWLSQDPIGFAARDANLYRYVVNGPTTKTDPSGLETFVQNRELNPRSRNSLRSREHVFTHTFIYTTDCDGKLEHTYSWGNEYTTENPSHWYIDRPEDVSAANDAIRQRRDWYRYPWYIRWVLSDNFENPVGNEDFDILVDSVVRDHISRGSWSPSAHGWKLLNNCKHEARNVLKDAQALVDGDWPDHLRRRPGEYEIHEQEELRKKQAQQFK